MGKRLLFILAFSLPLILSVWEAKGTAVLQEEGTALIHRDTLSDSLAVHQTGMTAEAIAIRLKSFELRGDTQDNYYKRVKKLIPKAHDSLNLTRLFYRFALFLSNHGKKPQAIGYYLLALKYAHALHYDKAISTIANDLGGEYWDLGERELSTTYYKEALAASIRINDSNRMAAIYMNLGGNYKEQGHLETGMEQMLKALKIKEALSDSSRLSFYYIQAAEIAKASRN